MTFALLALGYLVVVLFVLAVLRASKRADEAAEREQDAVLASPPEEAPATEEAPGRFAREPDREREVVLHRPAR